MPSVLCKSVILRPTLQNSLQYIMRYHDLVYRVNVILFRPNIKFTDDIFDLANFRIASIIVAFNQVQLSIIMHVL